MQQGIVCLAFGPARLVVFLMVMVRGVFVLVQRTVVEPCRGSLRL